MKISPRHFHRYRQIAHLLWRYGRSDLVREMGVAEEFGAASPGAPDADDGLRPDALADDLEAMGPTYVKLGQVLSSRPDLLPDAYLKALARLQDRVKPFAFADVEAIVERELGVRISKAFSRFERAPLAAASLGQVHAAALRDGREVVVKVQRPGIARSVAGDFEVLEEIARFIQEHTEAGRRHRVLDMLEEFRASIRKELDYELEAQNLLALDENLAGFGLIVVPRPVLDYTTRHVLTMEQVYGRKITAISPMARLEMDGAALAEELFRAYLKQVLVDGLFHADPHPGNVLLTEDCRIALIDLGMVGHTTPGMQESLLKTLMAVSDGRSEQAAETIIAMSRKGRDYDALRFKRHLGQLVAAHQGLPLAQINVGRTLLEATRAAGEADLCVPSELAMLGKTLLQLDEVGRALDPGFDPNAAIRRHAGELMSQRMKKEATQGSLLGVLLEAKGFLAGLPMRVNKIMDAVGDRELEVKVKAVDADFLMQGLQKIANRITSGVVLAALIVGAALLMRVDTDFRILGYPGLAMLCFLGAAAGGCWLLATIFITDRRRSGSS